jgi:hypothetical protein
MTISVSTNKEGATSLYVNDLLSSVDSIVWHELVIIPGDELITCYGILSGASVGLTNYKNKEWLPEGNKVSLKVYGGKTKQAYNKEAGKYQDTPVTKDELHLYSLLRQELDTHGGCRLKGFISPWVNPYYWEFSVNPVDAPRAKKINDETVSLSPIVGQGVLTDGEIDAFKATVGVAKKAYSGSYSKGETEADRLAARMSFFATQMGEICEFKGLYDLSNQIVGIRQESANMSHDKMLEVTIAQTIEFTKLILGDN